MSQQNLVRIGQKPVMNYVTACVTLLNSGNDEVVVRARGKAIEKAVDTVQLLQRSFLKNISIAGVHIGTEEVIRPNEPRGSISIIEITISKLGEED